MAPVRYKQSSTEHIWQLENLSSLRFRCCLLWYCTSALSHRQGHRVSLWQRILSIEHRGNRQPCLSKNVIAFSRICLQDSFSIQAFFMLTPGAHPSCTQERGKVQSETHRLSVSGQDRDTKPFMHTLPPSVNYRSPIMHVFGLWEVAGEPEKNMQVQVEHPNNTRSHNSEKSSLHVNVTPELAHQRVEVSYLCTKWEITFSLIPATSSLYARLGILMYAKEIG